MSGENMRIIEDMEAKDDMINKLQSEIESYK